MFVPARLDIVKRVEGMGRRCRAIVDMVGLELRPALIAREERLKKLAGEVERGRGENSRREVK